MALSLRADKCLAEYGHLTQLKTDQTSVKVRSHTDTVPFHRPKSPTLTMLMVNKQPELRPDRKAQEDNTYFVE